MSTAVGYWAHSGVFRDTRLMATLAKVGNAVRRSLTEPVLVTTAAPTSAATTSVGPVATTSTVGERAPKPVEFEAL